MRILHMMFAGTLLAGLLCTALPTQAAPDPATLLEKSDTARGGGMPGVYWSVQLRAIDGDKVDEQGLTVKADASNSLAEFFAPANISDQKLLIAGRTMWFIRSGLRKPVPISPRQRLLGQASNGDIAATNYAADYTAKLIDQEDLNAKPCYKLELTARNDQVSYPRIDYWVSVDTGLALKADFYSVSGKVFKTATFEYNNQVDYQGKKLPFVSLMTIEDRINQGQKTLLEYSNVKAQSIPARNFDINFLMNN